MSAVPVTRAPHVVLSARDVSKSYVVERGLFARPLRTVAALRGASLDVEAAEVVAVVGASGAGKSTLARVLAGLERPDSGSVAVRCTGVVDRRASGEGRGLDERQRELVDSREPKDSRELGGLHESWGRRHGRGRETGRRRLGEPGELRVLGALRGDELRRARSNVGIVFQDPFASLNPRLRANECVAEVVHVRRGLGRAASSVLAHELLARVGLDREHAQRFRHQLSGGERARVCLARALAAEPRVLVLDEPTASLDVSIQAQIVELLLALRDDQGLALVLVTHDLALVRLVADRVAVLDQGSIVECAPAEDVFERPRHAATQRLVRELG